MAGLPAAPASAQRRAVWSYYETQRPAICANGGCPIELTKGSHPSSNRGFGGETALRFWTGTSGDLSLLSVRLTAGALFAIEGDALVAETSSPTRNEAMAKAAPQQPTRYRE